MRSQMSMWRLIPPRPGREIRSRNPVRRCCVLSPTVTCWIKLDMAIACMSTVALGWVQRIDTALCSAHPQTQTVSSVFCRPLLNAATVADFAKKHHGPVEDKHGLLHSIALRPSRIA